MKNINDLQLLVDEEIRRQHRSLEPKELYDPIWYTMSSGGKRLRPVLVLMGCQLYSDRVEEALKPAIGIEMFHNFTLLHDDIMDKAFLRRNRPTVHIKWDVNRAILSGDALAIQSNIFIASCSRQVLPEVLDVFLTTALQVCEGQQYDLNFELKRMVTVEEYLNMIKLKTAVLLAGSLQIGAIIGGADKVWSQRVYDMGCELGMAFQLQDDLLDTFGDKDAFGKNIGGDILSDKKTYLLIKAYELASPEQSKALDTYFSGNFPNPEVKIREVRKIFTDLGVDQIIRERVREYLHRALEILDEIPVAKERKAELEKFSGSLMDRVR